MRERIYTTVSSSGVEPQDWSVGRAECSTYSAYMQALRLRRDPDNAMGRLVIRFIE